MLFIRIKYGHKMKLYCKFITLYPLQLFELGYNSENGPSHESVQTTLKNVCISAAVDSTHTVLLITSKDNLGTQAWENVCQIMEEGE